MTRERDHVHECVEFSSECFAGLDNFKDVLEGKIKNRELGHLLAAASYARALQYLRGAQLLIARFDLLAAHCLTRSAFECFYVLSAIVNDREKAVKLVRKRYTVFQQRKLKSLQKLGYTTMANGDLITDRLTILEDANSSLAISEDGSLRDLAELGDQLEHYVNAYALLSDRAHGAEADSIVQDQVLEEGDQIYIRINHEDSIKPTDVLVIAEAELDCWKVTADFFAAEPKGWTELDARASELWEFHGIAPTDEEG